MTASSRLLCVAVLAALVATRAAATAHAQDALPNGGDGQLFNVGQTCDLPRFDVRASLLYLQPAGGNLDYGTLVSPLPLLTPNWANQAVDPDFSPAFGLGLGYLLTETGNELQLAWTHLDASDSASVAADPDQFVGPPYEIGPDSSAYEVASATADFEYDSITFDAGQFLFTGRRVQIQVFGGVELARIDQDLAATFASADASLSTSYDVHSKFTGAGPRLGVKAQGVRGRFDFLGEMAGAVLIGNMESRMGYSSVSPLLPGLGVTPPNVQALTSPDFTQVVPSLASKAGLGYTFAGRRYGQFRIEGGYHVAVYVNAVNDYAISDVVLAPADQSVGLFLRTQAHLQSNFAVHGPYLSASWVF